MSGEWVIDLPYPKPPLNLNQRLHWAVKARLTAQIVGDVQTLARAEKLPRGLDRVAVTLHWQPKVARRRDSDNPTPTLKAAVDGLTRYGLTEDDDTGHLTSSVSIEPCGNIPGL